LDVQPGDVILDVGCGGKYSILSLTKYFVVLFLPMGFFAALVYREDLQTISLVLAFIFSLPISLFKTYISSFSAKFVL
jgi:4-amino-4-deoxy-L-arabinose transferase-like glycosyltransferase